MKQVKIGVGFGLWRLGMPSTDMIVRVAEHAEEWGLDSFWLSDHLLAPSPELDVVATLSLLASRTTRMKLGPSVLLLNLRHPLLVAKSFASLDYLSHGRMVMAVGTGANLADYAACGIPLESRGKRLDEGIEVLRTVWREPNASYHGKFFNFDNVTIDPRPTPRTNNDFGTMDIWVGGKSDAALKRAARLADGLFASFQTPEEFGASMAKVRDYAAGYGRANAHIESGLILLCRIAATREKALEEMRPMLSAMGRGAEQFLERSVYGSAEDIFARLSEYVAQGLDKFVLWPIAEPAAWPQQIELVGREIASHYNARAA
ncbi:MAG: LLM class flavin-dependent oxidoreductase [Candidatus Binatus sp.]|uniref:LLM class flavin-dependent oxidoreductase n=1 Tax=Candidatus Binatus sp. TaxID=2811406 RepID=UPI00271954F4|nr:LLM class flavin-dependent oxidoreductase [Candidatus Binatus sp.]MDO8431964.1 LLM class flavin-dependent oxidoreductase [Candidatus Binatus sp.]